MDREGLGFPPCRIDRGGQVHVAVGTQGEMVKLGPTGRPMGLVRRPFPAPIMEGVTLADRWVGFWVEREFHEARMAALPLEGDWIDGPCRVDLRLSSLAGSGIQPAGAIWLLLESRSSMCSSRPHTLRPWAQKSGHESITFVKSHASGTSRWISQTCLLSFRNWIDLDVRAVARASFPGVDARLRNDF